MDNRKSLSITHEYISFFNVRKYCQRCVMRVYLLLLYTLSPLYYTLNVRSQGKQLVLFSRES